MIIQLHLGHKVSYVFGRLYPSVLCREISFLSETDNKVLFFVLFKASNFNIAFHEFCMLEIE